MESTTDEEDVKLVKASAGLISDLEAALPKVLWKASNALHHRGRVHKQVHKEELDYLINLIEPFQGEPQLLDARLKHIVPLISEAYTEFLRQDSSALSETHLDLQTAICKLLYILCKVRGYKVVLELLNNETRYLEPILRQIEHTLTTGVTAWQVPYILLLWLSHLLLTPFDLASVADHRQGEDNLLDVFNLQTRLPAIAERVLLICIKYLPVATKTQDAAAVLLFRLVERPDMQKLRLADAVVSTVQAEMEGERSDVPATVYEKIGPLRFLAAITRSSELGHLVPGIYNTCLNLLEDEESSVAANAVAKKLMIKIFRNIAIVSLRPVSAQGPLHSFVEANNVLEDVIEYLLRSLGDRDTPVRYAAAKALSLVVLELDTNMGYEVIQAILDAFKEDSPRIGETLDFRNVNALRWHGLTLTLAHTVFRRSASPDQLHDIVNALCWALQFEQRTATGSAVGTNVRDAANFGIWSLSRRYTTNELLSVRFTDNQSKNANQTQHPVIQRLAVQLLLSACLDPVGNIRRGSSAALQEIIGRHPHEISQGIALVQVVDYQAVGLRRRAMLDVANSAADLHVSYWAALLEAVFEWRGLGSSDVSSRESAAASLRMLSLSKYNGQRAVLTHVMRRLQDSSPSDAEGLHGLTLTLAVLLEDAATAAAESDSLNARHKLQQDLDFRDTLDILLESTKDFSLRTLRSELPSSVAQLLAAVCKYLPHTATQPESIMAVVIERIDTLSERILVRHEDSIILQIPSMVQSLLALKRGIKAPLSCIGCQSMIKRVAVDASKSALLGAGRAIALGALMPLYGDGLIGERALAAVNVLCELTSAMAVDWRIIGIKALQLSIESLEGPEDAEAVVLERIVRAVHHAMNDYTIDERGDVGSLVRLQGISCTTHMFATLASRTAGESLQVLQADILRLSLEKLDRVRLAAAQCQQQYLRCSMDTADVTAVSSRTYFSESLRRLSTNEAAWKHLALLEGCISCAGVSAEPLLQASRSALTQQLHAADLEHLHHLMSIFTSILKSFLLENRNIHPALELLAFLFDMHILQRLAQKDFKWRNLLSTVQKSHHKSNDIPKILAAVRVYGGMADVPSIRAEVLKKLISMLRTNPYPKVRSNVAETLFVITQEPAMKGRDWLKPASQHSSIIELLEIHLQS